MQHIVFFHANGYPPGCYSQFLAALSASGTKVHAVDLGTPSDAPASTRFGLMAQLAVQAVAKVLQDASPGGCTSIALVGHSMGGYLALRAARQVRKAGGLSGRALQVVLIDSPMITGWRSALLSAANISGLNRRYGPAPIAARRRDSWPNAEAARSFFSSKRHTQAWAPGVLDDFLAHGLVSEASGNHALQLAVPRNTERDIYATLPHRQALRDLAHLKRHGVAVSALFGSDSRELRLASARINERLFAPHWTALPTGHLVPLEQPQACAAAVLRATAK